ncbi:phosphatase PAP2 family protein [Persicobacter psychrovividus]|uniref:Phosphatidic acid phosphatase type 2/haloperoxidase domain-containing protein n=1 Tax=Persicobacter psychrovividus TaxID=387638 RepID=A0ABM7VDU9_9BACT|nr:hypothetical protein PEPS_14130 [Persicobacter psychrovividus]
MKNKLKVVMPIYGLFLLIAGYLLLMYGKGPVEIWVNHHHFPFGDVFFKYATKLGEGVTLVLFAIGLARISRYVLFEGALVIIVQTILTFIAKRAFDIPRPSAWWPHDVTLNIVEGVSLHSRWSFPSGHTAMIFAVCGYLIIVARKSSWATLWLVIALTTAISRVYLAQHFLVDIYFGSLLGMGCAFAVHYHMNYWHPQLRKKWAKPLF